MGAASAAAGLGAAKGATKGLGAAKGATGAATAGLGAAPAGTTSGLKTGASTSLANIARVLDDGTCETASSCGVGNSFNSAGASFIFTAFDLKVTPLADILFSL